MGEIFEFPNNGDIYIRRAMSAYDEYQMEEMAAGFKKALAAYHNDLILFQDRVLSIFDEYAYYGQITQIIIALGENGEDPSRLANLLDLYEESIDDFDLPGEMDFIDGSDDLPDYIENLIVHGTEEGNEVSQANKNANSALQTLEMAERLIDNQQQLSAQQQLELLDRLASLPEEIAYNLVLNLIYGSKDYIFQTDLIHLLKNIVKEETVIKVPDMNHNYRDVDIFNLPWLMKHPFYLEGIQIIRNNYFQDPIFQEILINEWILICSYIYPFIEDFNESPTDLVLELYTTMIDDVDRSNNKKSFTMLNKIRTKILSYQKNF